MSLHMTLSFPSHRRRFLLSWCVVALLVLSAPSWAQDCTSNLIAHWKLDESTGTNANDETANGLDLTLVTMESTDWVAAKINNGLQFDGVNEQARRADNALFEPSGDMTIALWVKLTTLPSVLGHEVRLANKTHNGTPFESYALNITSPGNVVSAWWRQTDATSYLTTGTTALQIDTWYHVAYVHSGTTGYIYLNKSDDTASSATTSGTLYDSNYYMVIGAYNASYGQFAGILDDVRLFSRVLSAADIAACPPQPARRRVTLE